MRSYYLCIFIILLSCSTKPSINGRWMLVKQTAMPTEYNEFIISDDSIIYCNEYGEIKIDSVTFSMEIQNNGYLLVKNDKNSALYKRCLNCGYTGQQDSLYVLNEYNFYHKNINLVHDSNMLKNEYKKSWKEYSKRFNFDD